MVVWLAHPVDLLHMPREVGRNRRPVPLQLQPHSLHDPILRRTQHVLREVSTIGAGRFQTAAFRVNQSALCGIDGSNTGRARQQGMGRTSPEGRQQQVGVGGLSVPGSRRVRMRGAGRRLQRPAAASAHKKTAPTSGVKDTAQRALPRASGRVLTCSSGRLSADSPSSRDVSSTCAASTGEIGAFCQSFTCRQDPAPSRTSRRRPGRGVPPLAAPRRVSGARRRPALAARQPRARPAAFSQPLAPPPVAPAGGGGGGGGRRRSG